MPSNPTVAIIQEAPVFLNLAASTAKAIEHIKEAAASGANIISFAECWLPGYPVWLDFAPEAAIWDNPGAKALFRLLAENSVQRGDQHLRALQEIANETGAFIVIGAHERARNTLYNTTFTFTPGASAPQPHRKLVPTYTERLVWGRGDGSTLHITETPWGNLGSLICWEHWMPLARAAMHRLHETIHVAQWPAVKDIHQVASRHYAFEGRCAVAAAGSILSHSDVMEGFNSHRAQLPDAKKMLQSMESDTAFIHDGGSAIVAANGSYLFAPLFEERGILATEIDIAAQIAEAQTLDTDGHYSRPDVFELSVNTTPMPGVTFKDS